METPPNDTQGLKDVIHQFLQSRLQPKLDKLNEGEEEEREKLIHDHLPENWIPNAARRVAQIQQVTHAIKYSHPDARGTSLSSAGNAAAGDHLVGTHTLQGTAPPDVVGNAAALDVYKFLRLDLDGIDLLSRARDADPALEAALPGTSDEARSLMQSFAGLTEPKGEPASHKLAKQVYWPLGDGEYHLLAPLFPTSLVHGVYNGIRENRFSDAAKAAREARRERRNHDHGFCEYPDFAIQNFGGTKPQNISQLNSERHGENYLLAALPPSWNSEPFKPPLNMDSIFDRWLNRRKRIYRLTSNLRRFLLKVQAVNNVDIRNKRAELVALIRDEVMQLAAHLRDLPPGWSAQADCRLNSEECYWLDPDRGREDPEFETARRQSDWIDAVCHRFGNWLNARISTDRAAMGEPEHKEWKGILEKELRMMREELASDD